MRPYGILLNLEPGISNALAAIITKFLFNCALNINDFPGYDHTLGEGQNGHYMYMDASRNLDRKGYARLMSYKQPPSPSGYVSKQKYFGIAAKDDALLSYRITIQAFASINLAFVRCLIQVETV